VAKRAAEPILDYPLSAFSSNRTLLDALGARGIQTNGDLLGALWPDSDTRKLSSEIGFERGELDLLVQTCDLARVPGIGRTRATDLVVNLDIHGIENLREADPDRLLEGLRKREPRLKRQAIDGWIQVALSLELAVDSKPNGNVIREERNASNRQMTWAILSVMVLTICFNAVLYVVNRPGLGDLGPLDDAPAAVLDRMVSLLRLSELLRYAHYAVLSTAFLGSLLISVRMYAWLSDRMNQRFERYGGAEYRVLVRHIEKVNHRFGANLTRGIVVVAAIAFAASVLAMSLIPDVLARLRVVIELALESTESGSVAVPLMVLVFLLAPPLLLALRRTQRLIGSYPGITPRLVKLTSRATAAELSSGIVMLAVWASIGISLTLGLCDLFSEQVALPHLSRSIAVVRQEIEAELPEGRVSDTELAGVQALVTEGAHEFFRDEFAWIRRVTIAGQTLILLVLVAAIFVLILTTIYTVASAMTQSTWRRWLVAAGIVATTILIPFVLDFAMRSDPSFARLYPYLGFGIMLLGVMVGFAW